MEPTPFTFSSRDGTPIAAWRWDTAATPRGIVQLTHGMGEHVRRYDPLADALTSAGFHVVGQDHRGHGATAGGADGHGHLGAGGWPALVDDIGQLSAVARETQPGLPLVLLAHSMGSFAAQQYVLDRSADVDALVLTGTGALDLLEPALDLTQPLSLAMFNAAFEPARTEYDWLSRNEAEVNKYVADPDCGFGLDAEATAQMFVGARPLADPDHLARIRDDLPVYVAVGEQDPVHGNRALLTPVVERFRSRTPDVTLHVYPGARHEVFNETNRAEVVDDLQAWLNRVVAEDSA